MGQHAQFRCEKLYCKLQQKLSCVTLALLPLSLAPAHLGTFRSGVYYVGLYMAVISIQNPAVADSSQIFHESANLGWQYIISFLSLKLSVPNTFCAQMIAYIKVFTVVN